MTKMSEDIARIIERYVNYRTARKLLKKEWEGKDKPLSDEMKKMEGKLQEFLTAAGADSIAASTGTAYTTTKLSSTIKDMVAFKQYVLEQQQFSLVDWKANAKAVEAHVKSTGSLPPGVNFNAFEKVNVRRGDSSDEDE
jgi:hypothetical protein